MPKVREVIEALGKYNPDAEMEVIVHNQGEDFTICFGESDGVSMEDTEIVSFYVEVLNQSEKAA